MQLFDINSKINAKNIFYKIFYNEANEDFGILIFFIIKKLVFFGTYMHFMVRSNTMFKNFSEYC